MPLINFSAATTVIALFVCALSPATAEVLSPNDSTVSSSLALWLRNPDTDFDPGGGLWADSSGRGNDAAGLGQVGTVLFSTPTLANVPGASLSPGSTFSGVHFRADINDLLVTPSLNGGSGLSTLTIISIFRSSDTNSLTRPVGFGSIAATQSNSGNNFNLACDPSLRKDNGAITGYSSGIPVNDLFIRSARLDATGVDEWFNSDGTMNPVITNGGAPFTTSTDRFYLGDLRCGPTPVPTQGTAVSTANLDVIEVLVYTSALTDEQISGINEWLLANLGNSIPPEIVSFTASPGAIASGEMTSLSWEVTNANVVTISNGVGNVALTGTTIVAPTVTTTYTLTATGDGGSSKAEVTIGVDVPVKEPLINEFLAGNGNSLDDEDGDSSDWIELANPNLFSISLDGYFLTDDPANLQKWPVPAGTTINGGGYLVIFASGKDRPGAELHTNFSIERSGGYLALTKAGSASSEMIYPPQLTDYSYGPDSNATLGFLVPTPDTANGVGFGGKVADTKFSVNRGLYDLPQSVSITTETSGAEIRYTMDGSEPTLDNGTVYSAPILIDTTTVLRAAAFKDGLLPTNVDTHSYLFVEDIIRQSANPAGAPSTWGSRTPDYAMDQRVVDDPAYSARLLEGLKNIRTLSIVADSSEFFNGPNAIYSNPQNEGIAWEREVSFEFLHPGEPTEDVQTNGGIRIHGNGSRSASGQPKHSFRVEFRSEYGAKRLQYRLFPGTKVDEFDSLILRGQNAHGWTRSSQIASNVGTTEREQSQYIRDSFARDLMKNMGHTAGESTYVHLFINGLYWGLYNPVEYPRDYYGVSHFGGTGNDYDVINRRTTTTKILDGTFDAWNEMQNLANAGLTTQAAYEEMERQIDLDNLIDYMLMHQYMGSRDGPDIFNSNNMRALARTRGPNPLPWICMPWDMEASMFEIDVTRNVNVDDPNTLARVYTKLRENPEFRLRYADHVYRHCFHNGALTPANTTTTWEARAHEIDTAIIGESARWGDYRRPSNPFMRDVEWQQERNRLLTTYFPTRTDFLVNLLRQNNLFPEVDAPEFSQHGGAIPSGSSVIINSNGGAIYYTLDGSDPREPWSNNAIGLNYNSPIALTASATVSARVLDNGEWSALNRVDFLIGTPAAAGNLAISEIHYQPTGALEVDEFMELINLSATETLELGGVAFTEGITFTFPLNTHLAPGARLVITPNDYDGNLDNGGELVTLLDAAGNVIESFRYNDKSPWPTSSDGDGPSLTRILSSKELNDPSEPTSWRASVINGGTPGSTDAIPFTGDPNSDLDRDGLSALMEHALGTSDEEFTTNALTVSFADGHTLLSHPVSQTADDVELILEQSPDLKNWAKAPAILTSNESIRSFTLTNPGGSKLFLRLRAIR